MDCNGGRRGQSQEGLLPTGAPEVISSPELQCGGDAPIRHARSLRKLVAPMQTGSLRAAVLSLTFSAVGAGILGLPWAVADLGWGLGGGMLLLCTIASAEALCMLVDVREQSGCTSYAQAVDQYFGKRLGTVLSIILVLGSFGSACASMMFATTFLVDMLEMDVTLHLLGGIGIHTSVDDIENGWLAKPACAMTLAVILFIMAWPTDLTRWKYPSVACILILFYVSLVLVIKAFMSGHADAHARCSRLSSDGFVFASWPGLASCGQAAGVFIFSFCGHFNLFPSVNSLADPSRQHGIELSLWASALQATLYACIGFTGYITWKQALLRSQDTGNVLSCWAIDDTLVALGRTLMVLQLLVSATLNVHPVRENALRIIWTSCSSTTRRNLLMKRGAESDPMARIANPQSSPLTNMPEHAVNFAIVSTATWIYCAMTLFLLALLVLVVVFVPSVLDVLGFVGGLCGVALMFIFPAMLYIKVCRGSDAQPKMSTGRFYCAMTMFAVFSFLGLISVLKSMHLLGS
eukprot:TRINITY_DN26674_c0_g1_i1.p1 TRINITY_DN26674_c0_g1~~TRINITY_DN26674_c0_g1_i1.p1  ORF type:complete len:520 (-),score=85.73 TRINITY_DN26674_c0_g1_i1:461-2020(-)